MKKIILLTGIAAFIMTACQQKNTFTVAGTFANDVQNGKTVYLRDLDLNKGSSNILDSTKVENAKFIFIGKTQENQPVLFVLLDNSDQPTSLATFIVESGKIEINYDSGLKPTVKGTAMNDQYQQFITKASDITNKVDTVHKAEDVVYNFIKPNITNQVGQYFFIYYLSTLNDKQQKELISLSTPQFRQLEAVQQLQKQLELKEATAVGKQFVDIKGLNLDGKEVSLSDYAGKGKVVLIDFWASWCGPCRQVMPDMVNIYQKYKNSGFEIIGVSLDDNKDNWKNATQTLNITWPQLSNLKGWKEDAAVTYGINFIPQTVLIDKDGKIIERNLPEDELNTKLAELLGKK